MNITKEADDIIIENLRDKKAHLEAENRQLRADLIRAISEANRFEDAYQEVYRQLQFLKELHNM